MRESGSSHDSNTCCRLGDVVKAKGKLDADGHTLAVHAIDILLKWQDERPGEHFRPVQLVRHKPEQASKPARNAGAMASHAYCSVLPGQPFMMCVT